MRLRGDDRRLAIADTVEHDLQAALGDLRGIEQLEGAGREIARIGVRLQSGFLLLAVDALELGPA